MKQILRRHNDSNSLLVFFAGWGCDEHLFDIEPPSGYDYMLCYDYSSITFDFSLLRSYHKIHLIAWSLGVWMAAYTFSKQPINITRRIAINGTMHPKDDIQGIPIAIFDSTLASFSQTTLDKFRRRMCYNKKELDKFMQLKPYRDIRSLHEELLNLNNLISGNDTPSMDWDLAIMGKNDLIFPYANQQRAWQDTKTMSVDIAHYDKEYFDYCISNTATL